MEVRQVYTRSCSAALRGECKSLQQHFITVSKDSIGPVPMPKLLGCISRWGRSAAISLLCRDRPGGSASKACPGKECWRSQSMPQPEMHPLLRG
jgi:hypothetical protein